MGDRLNDTRAIVAKGIKSPWHSGSLTESPGAEHCCDPNSLLRGLAGPVASPAPDHGNTIRRAMDYLCAGSHSGVQRK